jgi:hypothetical protein
MDLFSSIYLGDFAECNEAADRQKNQTVNVEIESDYEREPRRKSNSSSPSTGMVALSNSLEHIRYHSITEASNSILKFDVFSFQR